VSSMDRVLEARKPSDHASGRDLECVNQSEQSEYHDIKIDIPSFDPWVWA
jgi:hypothetical protein